MGIIDFVKGGVQKMMILRPDSQKDKVVYKHPDQTFPFWSQLTVDSDEVCLFFKDGQYRGVLGPGRHTLDTQNIPFLGVLVDKFTGGNVFVSELFFVTTSPIYGQGFGGPIGSMRDPELDIRVNPRVFGTYSFRVVDPVRFVIEFWRQRAGDPESALQWVRDQLVMGVKSTLTRLLRSAELTMMDLGGAGPDVARAIVQSCPDLTNIGVQVLEIAKLNINLSEEDQARIDEFQDQIVQAKLDTRKARLSIDRAAAEAQAKQFALDQDFANRARYMNQLDMARYQQYAAAEATMGLGQGLAQGGEGAPGLVGAQMAAGMGLGAGMMMAHPQPPMHAGYSHPYPGGMPPQAPYPMVQPQPPAAGYPGWGPGAPQQAGAPLQPQPPQAAPGSSMCPKCATASPGRFCTNCGTQLV
ncbi:MAG TPA: SPFH domain-containing protein [Polyangiaceae bacterium]|nr:SPFH domain-containing protein [Polyangiaceae bacterium]